VAIALSVLGGFSLIVLGGQIQQWLGSRFGFGDALLVLFSVFRWVIILAGLLLAFSVIYYLAPNVEQKFKFITAGSVGAVMVLMMWLYIAGLAILFDSEINALIQRHVAGGKQNAGNAIGQHKRNADTR